MGDQVLHPVHSPLYLQHFNSMMHTPATVAAVADAAVPADGTASGAAALLLPHIAQLLLKLLLKLHHTDRLQRKLLKYKSYMAAKMCYLLLNDATLSPGRKRSTKRRVSEPNKSPSYTRSACTILLLHRPVG